MNTFYIYRIPHATCKVSLQSFDITPPKSFLSIIIIIIIIIILLSFVYTLIFGFRLQSLNVFV